MVVKIDLIRNLSAIERDGALVGMTREVVVSGLTDGSFEALFSALDDMVVEDSTLAPGKILNSSHPELILRERHPMIIDKDNMKVRIILTYEHFFNEAQELLMPELGLTYVETRSGLQQITTNRYPNDYETAALQGRPIVMDHIFPDGTASYKYYDKDGNSQDADADPERSGLKRQQVGEISVHEPMETKYVRAVLDMTDLAQSHLASLGIFDAKTMSRQCRLHVNEDSFFGDPAGQWLCTRADYKPMALSGSLPEKYLFDFEFQWNPEGWQPVVIFKDDRTGDPPISVDNGLSDPTEPNGDAMRRINYYPEIDFNRIFTTFEN